jgi:hypothetical protein
MDDERNAAARPGLGALVVGIAVGFAVTALVSAFLAPAAYALVEAIAPGAFPFQRVFRRATLLVALVALVVGLRAAGVRRLADVGLGAFRRRVRVALAGAVYGALAIVVAFAAEIGFGRRALTPANLAPAAVAEALGAGAAVGLLEEGVCRGALLFPFGPFAGVRLAAANATTSALYATAHLLRGGGRPGTVDAWSGFRLWRQLPRVLVQHIEAWVGLFLTGAILYLVAARQGHAWGAVGVHAGAVVALQTLGVATAQVAGREPLFLVDGLLPGWGLSALLLVVLVAGALWLPRAAVSETRAG